MTKTFRAVPAVLLGMLTLVGNPAAQAPAGPVRLDRQAVQRWVDSLVEPALETSGIPGALVVVVQRAEVVFNKAYGFADVGARIPATADRTLFEFASIGKTMTSVIASQLIDEGVLDLDEDVNRYLKTARVSGPKITLRMLLAHRGGFDVATIAGASCSGWGAGPA